MAKTVKDERYLCVSAYIRALEAQLLTAGDLQRMIDADDLSGAIQVLTDRGYPPMTADLAAMEEALRQHREDLMSELSDFLPDGSVLDLFRIRYDYHNAKVALKSQWTGVDGTRLLMGGGRLEPLRLYQMLHRARVRCFRLPWRRRCRRPGKRWVPPVIPRRATFCWTKPASLSRQHWRQTAAAAF